MKHQMSGTRFYQIWCAMKQRCFYPKHNRFKNYGGRGITICEEWLDFQNFYKDMYRSYVKHWKKHGENDTTIDRIDTNGNYTKENCRFTTLWNQNLNRANNHLLTYKGKTKPLTQWAREKGFKRGLLENRIRRGWSVKKMLETPTIEKFGHRTDGKKCWCNPKVIKVPPKKRTHCNYCKTPNCKLPCHQ